jgi:hypothetical protein
MSVAYIGEFPLGAINVGLTAQIGLLVPLLAQFDLMLTGSFGLGALAADLSAQLSAAIGVQAQVTLQISDPFAALEALIAAFVQIQAQVSLILTLGLPNIAAQLAATLSASLSISAGLSLNVSGVGLLIEAALAVKLPAINLLAELQEALTAGPFVLLAVGYDSFTTLEDSGFDYQALTTGPIGSPTAIYPTDQVYGVMILTKSPSASASLSAILLTS